MLRELLAEIENTDGALDLNSLSRKMGTSHQLLDMMLETLVRQGRLKEKPVTSSSACHGCSKGCPTTSGCNLRPVNTRIFSLNINRKG